MLASPLARHRFQGAILMSNSIEPGETRPLAESEAAGAGLATREGCAGTDAAQVACLRALSAEEILRIRLPTPPVRFVIDDGFFVDGDVALTLKKHGAGVPVIVGSTRAEESLAHDLTPITPDDFTAAVQAEFPALADQLLPLYPLADYPSPLAALIAVESDGFDVCLSRLLAEEFSLAHRAPPVFRYLFTHAVENDPDLAQYGAYHGEDIAFVFGDFDDEFAPGYAPTPGELALKEAMQAAFTRFIQTGDPGWPAYSVANDDFLQFDDAVSLGSGYHAAACNLFAPIY
jgi:para-nitrobenzyl esterase